MKWIYIVVIILACMVVSKMINNNSINSEVQVIHGGV